MYVVLVLMDADTLEKVVGPFETYVAASDWAGHQTEVLTEVHEVEAP